MTVEQFNTIVELLPRIEKELKEKGLELARPRYDADSGEEGKEQAEDVADEEVDAREKDEDEEA